MASLIPIVESVGYVGISLILFAESGLLIGVVLPGDTLLFAAGLLAAKGFFNIYIVLVCAFVASVAGDSLGYWIGRKIGPKIFKKEDSFFFKRSYVERSQKFFQKHGRKTIFLARFVPIVRTFAPLLAGVGEMKYKSFFAYNVFGALAWTVSIGLLAFFFGTRIPNIDTYMVPILAGIILLSFIPVAREYWKTKRGK